MGIKVILGLITLLVATAAVIAWKVEKKSRELKSECPNGGMRSDVIHFGEIAIAIRIDKTEDGKTTTYVNFQFL